MNLNANIACNCEIFTCLRQGRMLRRLWSMCLIRSIPYVHKLFYVCKQHIPLCWLNVDSTLLVELVSSETSRCVTNNIPSRKLTCLTFFPVPDEVSVGSSQAEQNSYLKEKKQYFLLPTSDMSAHGPGTQIHVSPDIISQRSRGCRKRLAQQQEVTNPP